MTRFREFGLSNGYLPTGQYNAITDVDGIKVGHLTLIKDEHIRTGVTAILPHSGNLFTQKVPAAVYTINGFGKATGFEQVRELGNIETPILLTNTLNVGKVADALVGYMVEQNPKLASVNPLVGECNDGFLNDIHNRHVTAEHVLEAINTAKSGSVSEGNIGAGTGTQCYGFKGGIGTASRISDPYTVGVLVQTNFGARRELQICGVPIGEHLKDSHLAYTPPVNDGSVMIVIVTNAPLTSRQLQRLTKRASFGLARTGTVCHHGSGDFVIAFSTQNTYAHDNPLPVEPIARLDEQQNIDGLFTAVVESVEEAVYNALLSAETMTGKSGRTLYGLPHDEFITLMKQYNHLNKR